MSSNPQPAAGSAVRLLLLPKAKTIDGGGPSSTLLHQQVAGWVAGWLAGRARAPFPT